MNDVTNGDIYGVLLDIKEDIGGLKIKADLQMEGLKSHHSRIATLEAACERQKGAVTVWGLVAAGLATLVSAAIQFFRH